MTDRATETDALHGSPDDEVRLGDAICAISDAVAGWIARVLEDAPPEPCAGQHFAEIPLREWRRGLNEWCRSRFVRGAFGFELTEGLRLALADFDDETLVDFLESMT